MPKTLEKDLSGQFKVLALGLIASRGIDDVPPKIKENLSHAIKQGVLTNKEIDEAQTKYKDISGPIQKINLVRLVGLEQLTLDEKRILARGVVYGTITHKDIVEAQKEYNL